MCNKLRVIYRILRGQGVIYRARIRGGLDLWPILPGGHLTIMESDLGGRD